jgi:hypothetical protein
LQRWRLLEVQGSSRGQVNERLNYSQFIDYCTEVKKEYDQCRITKHSLEMVLQQFDDFKIVSNFSIIDELLNNYLLMIHTGMVKITITEWKDCPITELMEHYSYYKYMSKSNNKD